MKPIRGVWIPDVDSNVLDSRSNIANALKLLADTGFNYLFPVVWNGGFTQYRSQIMRNVFGFEIEPKPIYKNRDPLAEIIEEANKLNLKVIPWFEYGFACSYRENGGHILAKKPDWAAKDINNQLLTKNGFEWLNPFNSEVRDFLLSLILEIANQYPIAGIQGDDRLPALPSEGGYDTLTKKLYLETCDRQPPSDRQNKQWLQWRADLLTNFLERIYREIKTIDEKLIISMAPSPYLFGFKEYLQDYPTWLKKGIVDIIHPQLYRRDVNSYKSLLKENLKYFNDRHLKQLYPGILIKIGNYHIKPEELWECIKYNRTCGIEGEILFFIEELKNNNCALAKFLQTQKYHNS